MKEKFYSFWYFIVEIVLAFLFFFLLVLFGISWLVAKVADPATIKQKFPRQIAQSIRFIGCIIIWPLGAIGILIFCFFVSLPSILWK